MTSPKKRLTLADVNKKIDMVKCAQNSSRVIRDAEIRHIREYRSAIHQRLEDLERDAVDITNHKERLQKLERDAVNDRELLFSQEGLVSEGHEIAALDKKIEGLERKLVDMESIQQNKIKALEYYNSNRIDEIRELKKVVKTLGPLWKTRAGHTMPVVLLSTPHLKSLLSGKWVHAHGTLNFIRKELTRRTEDKKWRVLQGDSEEQSQEERFSTLERLVSKLSLASQVSQDEDGDVERQLKRLDSYRRGHISLNASIEGRLKTLERRVKQNERDIYDDLPEEIDLKKPTSKTIYVDAFGNCTDTFGNPVEPSVANRISDIKDDVKELQLDLNQQHSMIDIYGNRLDKLEDEDEDDSYVDDNGDLVLPLKFPQGADKIAYTITRGRKNGKPFITYGDVQIEAPKRGFLSRILSWLR